MSIKIDYPIKIPFHDVDSMHVAWHGHYAKYFELARCKLLDQIDFGYQAMRDSGYAWPIIDMQMRYIYPLRFEQEVVISAEIVEWEHRLKIQYRIKDPDSGKTFTKANTVQVAVDVSSHELCLECPVILQEKIFSSI